MVQEPVNLPILPPPVVAPVTQSKTVVSQKVVSETNLTVNLANNVTVVRSDPDARNCVGFLRSEGVAIPQGYGAAKNLPVTTKTPTVGAVVVTYESVFGHVGLVTSVNGDGTITLEDGNYISGKVTIRKLPVNSNLIKGFF